MNPIYSEFFKAFSLMLAQTQQLPLPESRAASTHFFTQNIVKEHIFEIQDTIVQDNGSQSIPIRIFKPSASNNLPITLFFHSGGWAFGSIEDADAICRRLANLTNSIFIAVEYRLAPENPFPIGLEDCYTATKWAFKNAKLFGGDPLRIGVCGESCGGNLAAAVALMARDKNEFKLSFQLLLYPVMTNELNKKIYQESIDQSFITFDVMSLFWSLYLPNEEKNNPYASPLKSKDLTDLPPCFIVTAEHDPLHVEGEEYALKLRESRVLVRCKNYSGAVHSFLSLPIPDLPERLEALSDIQSQFNSFTSQQIEQSNIKLRTAEKSEIDWVNDCYDHVEFLHSNFDNEIIAIAEYKGQKAGIGRLVKIDEQNLELGGMYVFESFRNKGIAKEIVNFLLTFVKPIQTVYCIPFEHLLQFYQQYGFTKCTQLESVPSKILDKYHWCLKKYPEPTALLIFQKQ